MLDLEATGGVPLNVQKVRCVNQHKMWTTITIWLWLTFCHGKSPFLIGKPSINGPFPMAMLNNRRVKYIAYHVTIFSPGFSSWLFSQIVERFAHPKFAEASRVVIWKTVNLRCGSVPLQETDPCYPQWWRLCKQD